MIGARGHKSGRRVILYESIFVIIYRTRVLSQVAAIVYAARETGSIAGFNRLQIAQADFRLLGDFLKSQPPVSTKASEIRQTVNHLSTPAKCCVTVHTVKWSSSGFVKSA